jgi:heme exporter protein D
MTINEFLNMSGYAVYVWSSFGLTFVMLIWQIIQPLMQQKLIQRSIVRNLRRNRGQPQ